MFSSFFKDYFNQISLSRHVTLYLLFPFFSQVKDGILEYKWLYLFWFQDIFIFFKKNPLKIIKLLQTVVSFHPDGSYSNTYHVFFFQNQSDYLFHNVNAY